jgi:RNA polymerase sigma factor (sigma-70 family)
MSAVSEPAASTCAAGTSGAGDVGELFALHAKRLEQIVRVDVRAPQPLIEDACQFAWSRLVSHAHRIQRETALPWLVRTASRQAFKLIRREARELSLEHVLEVAPEPLDCLRASAPDELVERRQRLASICLLPQRQQRLVWLQGLGLSYDEMAEREGYTTRTVERQLLRAKRAMRASGSA